MMGEKRSYYVFILQIFQVYVIIYVANIKYVIKYGVDKITLNVDKRREWSLPKM